MAKKSSAPSSNVSAGAEAAAKPVKKPRGPRGIKLALPTGIQKQLSDLPDLYPKLKPSDVQGRFLALLSPSLDAAYQSSFEQLVSDLEAERTSRLQAIRNLPQPPANGAPDYADEDYRALDDDSAQ